MFRAMALKELREIRGIALAGLLVYALLLVSTIAPEVAAKFMPSFWPSRSVARLPVPWRGLPFVNDPHVGTFHLASAGLAIALGLWQTVNETVRGTYPFLVHRPVTRRWLVCMKLSAGVAVCLVCAAVPLLAYGLWAATPGHQAGPFAWSMTLPAWVGWFAMTLVYLGAFLSGFRPARWYGSRLLPLVVAAVVATAATGVARDVPPRGLIWPCLAVAVASAWMIACIFFVARTRDFS